LKIFCENTGLMRGGGLGMVGKGLKKEDVWGGGGAENQTKLSFTDISSKMNTI